LRAAVASMSVRWSVSEIMALARSLGVCRFNGGRPANVRHRGERAEGPRALDRAKRPRQRASDYRVAGKSDAPRGAVRASRWTTNDSELERRDDTLAFPSEGQRDPAECLLDSSSRRLTS
jgi:hypothetical protein